MADVLSFLLLPIISAILIGIGAGIVSPFVHVNKLSFLTGAIAHAILAGIGISVLFGGSPILGSILSAPIFATLVGFVHLKGDKNSDTIIGAVWSVGMAIGVICLYHVPGYGVDFTSLLFGNILLITTDQLVLLGILDVIIIGLIWVFYGQLLTISFDKDYAEVRGLNVTFYYLLLINIISITVVLAVYAVGLILVIALMLLPAAIARMFTTTFKNMVVACTAICICISLLGIWASYKIDLPTGPTIILLMGLAYVFALLVRQKQLR